MNDESSTEIRIHNSFVNFIIFFRVEIPLNALKLAQWISHVDFQFKCPVFHFSFVCGVMFIVLGSIKPTEEKQK